MRPLVLKLGGELLESRSQRERIAALAAVVSEERGLVIVHGGGRAIDAELARRQITPKKVDGLRITDVETLEAVVAVLAGTANTELVAALVGAGVLAVGLTGVDAGFGRARRSRAHTSTSGAVVDLGFVGDPTQADPSLIQLLVSNGYVPVVASLGYLADDDQPGQILNVNADVMACRIATALEDCELVIAGATPGVLDSDGRTIPSLDPAGIDDVINSGTATAGMVAKLSSCRTALLAGVPTIRLIDGRDLDAAHGVETAPGTTLTANRKPRTEPGGRFRVH
ncbi:MAG: acetylglutamate kinase [Acidobacteriota bacterium]|jgi:acetylglutamate kinase|nr:MAG: acetylglutamate kinase [Acidobacteriota bacterium]